MYTKSQQKYIDKALDIIAQQWTIAENTPAMTAPQKSVDYLRLYLANENKRECFVVLFLNSQHQLLAAETLFTGTIDGAAVYPREVARKCLDIGAAAVVLGHNHPSGLAEPSSADRRITARIKDALALFDIRTLDHVIVGGANYYSFAENGGL